MKDEASDALFDVSEPAMSERVLRFRQRCQESPIDRASQAALNAVEDLNLALHTATSPEELRQVRLVAEEVISQLVISASVALTLEEHWDSRR